MGELLHNRVYRQEAHQLSRRVGDLVGHLPHGGIGLHALGLRRHELQQPRHPVRRPLAIPLHSNRYRLRFCPDTDFPCLAHPTALTLSLVIRNYRCLFLRAGRTGLRGRHRCAADAEHRSVHASHPRCRLVARHRGVDRRHDHCPAVAIPLAESHGAFAYGPRYLAHHQVCCRDSGIRLVFLCYGPGVLHGAAKHELPSHLCTPHGSSVYQHIDDYSQQPCVPPPPARRERRGRDVVQRRDGPVRVEQRAPGQDDAPQVQEPAISGDDRDTGRGRRARRRRWGACGRPLERAEGGAGRVVCVASFLVVRIPCIIVRQGEHMLLHFLPTGASLRCGVFGRDGLACFD